MVSALGLMSSRTGFCSVNSFRRLPLSGSRLTASRRSRCLAPSVCELRLRDSVRLSGRTIHASSSPGSAPMVNTNSGGMRNDRPMAMPRSVSMDSPATVSWDALTVRRMVGRRLP